MLNIIVKYLPNGELLASHYSLPYFLLFLTCLKYFLGFGPGIHIHIHLQSSDTNLKYVYGISSLLLIHVKLKLQ